MIFKVGIRIENKDINDTVLLYDMRISYHLYPKYKDIIKLLIIKPKVLTISNNLSAKPPTSYHP